MKLSKKWNTVTPFSKFIALALFVLLPFIGFYLGMKYQKLLNSSNEYLPVASAEGIACTMDAKICPDGSAVGRVPPSCEFAPCPK